MVEILDPKTAEEWKEQYRTYPTVTPDGFAPFHTARVEPIAYEIPARSKVLDVGANDGEFLKLLRDKRDCEIYGIDMSEVAVAKAKEKGVDVILGDAEKIPFPDSTFDVVMLNEVLIHLINPSAVLQEIRRVLKPEGFLIGSAPHANLERFVWEERRLHHRYLDEKDLRDLLEPLFPFVFVRTLNGAQFAVSLATSFLADKPAEMLFKAGGKKTTDWEVDAVSDDKLRVWFGYTQLGGTIYYRMLSFADKMDKLGLIQSAYEHSDWDKIDDKAQQWQTRIRNRIVLGHLENILKIAHVSVWQITHSRDVLAFLRCAKDIANIHWYKATGQKKYFVTEIDDNLFDIPSYNIASNPYKPNSEPEWVALEQIKLSDALVCSTKFLGDKMSAMFPDKPVHIVPNSIDFDIWDNVKPEFAEPRKNPGQIRIGYTGCSNHRGDLELIKDPLQAILKEFPNVQFLYTPQPEKEGGYWGGWEGIENMLLVGKWVPIDKYPAFVSGWDLDIGVAPLLDNEFNRAKSNLRWLEYSAMKLPTVASRVYPFKNTIRDGEDGIICNTSEEWYKALKNLIVDVIHRKRIGENAYARVKADFNLETVSKSYAKILEGVRK